MTFVPVLRMASRLCCYGTCSRLPAVINVAGKKTSDVAPRDASACVVVVGKEKKKVDEAKGREYGMKEVHYAANGQQQRLTHSPLEPK